MLERGEIDMGHARCLLMLEEHQQQEIALQIIAKGLSVRETESWVSRMNARMVHKKNDAHADDLLFKDELHGLAQQLQTKVSIKSNKSGKGTIIIHYNGTQSLRRVIQQLSQQPEHV